MPFGTPASDLNPDTLRALREEAEPETGRSFSGRPEPDTRDTKAVLYEAERADQERYSQSWRDWIPFTDSEREQFEEISRGLMRADPLAEPEKIAKKAITIEKSIDIPGLAASLTWRDFVTEPLNFFSGVANLVTRGDFNERFGEKGSKKKFDEWASKLGKGPWRWGDAFEAIVKLWKDSPEFPDADVYAAEVIKQAANIEISTKEAAELTGFTRGE